jgi:uncharacterized protein (DUF4415 family)
VPKDKDIVRHTLHRLPSGPMDWERVDALTDQELEEAIRSDPDAAPISDEQWFRQARLVVPAHLKHLWLQLDEDLVAWFREQDGERWRERVNAVLRAHVERQKKARRKAG